MRQLSDLEPMQALVPRYAKEMTWTMDRPLGASDHFDHSGSYARPRPRIGGNGNGNGDGGEGPPPPVYNENLSIVGVEVTQATQCFNFNGQGSALFADNGIPAVARKTTVLRAYVDRRTSPRFRFLRTSQGLAPFGRRRSTGSAQLRLPGYLRSMGQSVPVGSYRSRSWPNRQVQSIGATAITRSISEYRPDYVRAGSPRSYRCGIRRDRKLKPNTLVSPRLGL